MVRFMVREAGGKRTMKKCFTRNTTKTRRKNGSGLCSRCPNKRDNKHRALCLRCHAKSMREWRKTHNLSGVPLMKARARAYARVYVERGKIKKENCIKCGSRKSQMHHEDYSRPLIVKWMCRPCHLKEHKKTRRID